MSKQLLLLLLLIALGAPFDLAEWAQNAPSSRSDGEVHVMDGLPYPP